MCIRDSSNSESIPIEDVLINLRITLHTFTVHKCHIKWVAHEQLDKLTTHRWTELNQVIPKFPAVLKTTHLTEASRTFDYNYKSSYGLKYVPEHIVSTRDRTDKEISSTVFGTTTTQFGKRHCPRYATQLRAETIECCQQDSAATFSGYGT